MANRVLGLAGSGEGPWVCTADITNPLVCIKGLKEGEAEIYGSMDGRGTGELVLELVSSSIARLKYYPFMRAVYRGKDRIILTFHQGRGDALQSD